MSTRAVMLGLMLGLVIAAGTYFNDWIMVQTPLIGNQLPVVVLGPVLLLLLGLNPLLSSIRRGPRKCAPLRAGELAVIAAIGLAACGYPGSGFMRTFPTTVAKPAILIQTRPTWQSTGVMSYVPGGSPLLAPGQVMDWRVLADRLVAGEAAEPESLAGEVWSRLPDSVRPTVLDEARGGAGDHAQRNALLGALNAMIAPSVESSATVPLVRTPAALALPSQSAPVATAWRERSDALWKQADDLASAVEASDGHVADQASGARRARLLRQVEMLRAEAQSAEYRANRALLEVLSDGALAAAPQGEGVLLAGGRADPFASSDTLVQGWTGAEPLTLRDVPWRLWWPVLRLWGGVAVLLGVACLCLTLVVHRQWAHRELLAYPIVRFVHEITSPPPESATGARRWLPAIASHRLFWIGLGGAVVLHLINGVATWLDLDIAVSLTWNFRPLSELFTTASRAPETWGLFSPRLYLAVVGFAFFLSGEVSLSLGLSTFAWALFASLLIRNGVAVSPSVISTTGASMMRFGAFAGFALMIVYTGRHYYMNVLSSAFGRRRPPEVSPEVSPEVPGYATNAARVALLCSMGAVLLLQVYGGLDWRLGTLAVVLVLLQMMVVTRINVETGAFFLQAGWLPITVLTALMGMEGLGPQAFLVLALFSVLLATDTREALAPFLANALHLGDRVANTSPRRLAPWLGVMLLASFAVAFTVTILLQYNLGASLHDRWGGVGVPAQPFDLAAAGLQELAAKGDVAAAIAVHGWGHFLNADVTSSAMPWMGGGLVLVLCCAAARLRLPWWPLHPVMFLVWCTYPMSVTAVSFLVGWLIRTTVIRVGGVKAYRNVLPLMVGLVGGELLAALGWQIAGAIHFGLTGTAPPQYVILPG